MRCMKRSRVTLAITDAAAIAALVASPPTTGALLEARRRAPGSRRTGRGSPRPPTRAQHVAQRREVRLVQPALVDPAHAARGDRDARSAARSTRGYSASRTSVVCCLESLSARQRAQVARASAARSRTAPRRRPAARRGSRARPRRRRPRSARPSARSKRNSRRPLRAPSAARARRIALEEADALGRPVGGEGAADDPFSGTGPQKRLSSDEPRLSPIMK